MFFSYAVSFGAWLFLAGLFLYITIMKKKAAPKKAATKKAAKQQEAFELLAIEVPAVLAKGMEVVGITDRQEYINFLIASSLLNYAKIWKSDKDLEKEIKKIKEKSDSEIYMR
jgi:hypothetical protein